MGNALAELAHVTKQHSIPVLVTVLPDGRRPMRMIKLAVNRLGFFAFDPRPAFLTFLKRHGFELEDFQCVFHLSDHDAHPNERAHRLYAKALAREIHRRGLLPTLQENDRSSASTTR